MALGKQPFFDGKTLIRLEEDELLLLDKLGEVAGKIKEIRKVSKLRFVQSALLTLVEECENILREWRS